MEEYEIFDIDSDELLNTSSKLIEASAGTGKTYNIVLLVIRILTETDIPVNRILLVTFTNSAVAELESRVRSFIRSAYNYAAGGDESVEQPIKDRINFCVNDKGINRDIIIERLRSAVAALDETNIKTIHSFCQEVLSEFSFETRQNFESEIISDESTLVEMAANKYWRENVATLDPELLSALTSKDLLGKNTGLTISNIKDVIKRSLDGRSFVANGVADREAIYNLRREVIESYNDFTTYVIEYFEDFCACHDTYNHHAKAFFDKCVGSSQSFISEFEKKYKENPKTGYLSTYFGETHPKYLMFINARNALSSMSSALLSEIFSDCALTGIDAVRELKTKFNKFSYDDIIEKTREALDNDQFRSLVARKYAAVFIDEFQDTDRSQYEIFHRIFNGNSNLIFIGDPKQLIFAWRKADLNTYINARSKVDVIYSMTKNFRSNELMVDACNEFFNINDPFKNTGIKYFLVTYGQRISDSLNKGADKEVPVSIMKFPNQHNTVGFTVSEITRLLRDDSFRIGTRKIEPKDIAVIVRTGYLGKEVKKHLSRKGVNSVIITKDTIFKTEEAKNLMYLLAAVRHPDRGGINRVLLNPAVGFNLTTLKNTDIDAHLKLFQELKALWATKGVYNMITSFIQKYDIRRRCIDGEVENGERIITTFLQLMESLHEAEKNRHLNENELIGWYTKAIEGTDEVDLQDEDKQLLRLESDEDAVTITTVHKAKGQTYGIVFVLGLEGERDPDHLINYDKREDDGAVTNCFALKDNEQGIAQCLSETSQEKRRLIYVAVTRAVYKCYIVASTNNPSADLFDFIKAVNTGSSKITTFDAPAIDNPIPDNAGRQARRVALSRKSDGVRPFEAKWDIHSFSSLSRKHEPAELIERVYGDHEHYDRFIFEEMTRGAKLGSFLHSIFEYLDFTKPDTYSDTLDVAGKYYRSVFMEEHRENHLEMIRHCMNVTIPDAEPPFSLNQVASEKRLTELEFCYSLGCFTKRQLTELIPEVEFSTEREIEGMMTGSVDLFFEHKGKYYILDWKSNHLGNYIINYIRDGMDKAMRAGNYHLQYHIYTIAVKRYLELKLGTDENGNSRFNYDRDFGGVIYLFLRGVRAHDNRTGVYFDKPELEIINSLDKLFFDR